jgi:predicted XRE-type DNA-binding protein
MVKQQKKRAALQVTGGGTNVFAHLAYPNATEHQTKAKLVSQIARLIEEQSLTQAAVAKRLGIDQPKVSAMLNGRFRGFSVYRLMLFLSALGLEVNIVTSSHTAAKAKRTVAARFVEGKLVLCS